MTLVADQPVLVKCLVWDLDGTVWDGTMAEGDDIRLREAASQVIAELDSRGILQSVCSRNDYEPAWQRLSEFGLAEYFVEPQIGFGRKSDAIRRIADQLRFDLATIAVIDDSPAELAEISFHLPQVRCFAADQVTTLPALRSFTPPVITPDARRRRQLYQASHQRQAEQAAHTGPDHEFLRSLRLVMRVARATDDDVSRAAELTVRTSQMNATGLHYSAGQVDAFRADPGHEVLVTTLSDRFGPYGTIGVALLVRYPRVWHLRLLATSCRVMFCGAGSVILRWLTSQAATAGVHLAADFRATPRNRIAELAYRFGGFSESGCECLGSLVAPGPGIQRFHLVSAPAGAEEVVDVRGPDLTSGVSATSS